MNNLVYYPASISPTEQEWILNTRIQKMESPFSGYTQIIEVPGSWWSCKLKYDLLSRDDFLLLKGFIFAMSNGSNYTYINDFTHKDRDIPNKDSMEFTYDQSTNILEYSNASAGEILIHKVGEMFTLLASNYIGLKVSNADVYSNSGIASTNEFYPSGCNASSGYLILSSPYAKMKLADGYKPAFNIRQAFLNNLTIELVESFI